MQTKGQNEELMAALAELEKRQAQIAILNRELADTNRGVVALYAELEEKAEHLRRASETKTRFLSNMTHEFRTPLNSILTLSKLLLDRIDGELTPEQELQVNFIRRAATDLSDLVNDLLDLAKIEAGKVVVRPAAFQLTDVFAGLRGTLRPLLLANPALNLVVDEPDGVPPLYTDETKVTQVLRNFISNALKFTERGEVRVSATMEGEHVVISVADTGIGVAPADQERIFEEFTQVEGPHQGKVKGTGLGLPLARQLAQLLGGEVKMVSQVGVGSTFSLVIPARYGAAGPGSLQDHFVSTFDPTRVPILVIDDNHGAQFLHEKAFKGTGFQLMAAHSAAQARAVIRQVRPAAIVIDPALNHGDDWSLVAELKASNETKGAPLIVLSSAEHEATAMASGADDFHPKPIDERWLIGRLRELTAQYFMQKILVIDDDEVSRYLVRSLLATSRFQVLEAKGGREGLQLAREILPDAVVLDLAMADLNGFEVLAELKRDTRTQSIPVVINTSRELDAADRTRLDQHAAAILPKKNSDWEASHGGLARALVDAGLGYVPR
jgi:signal transduction histidine kinase/CheY-like chemotaxis protein